MPNRYDIAVADENMRFTELNTAFRHLSCAGDNEKPLAILLDLGSLMAPQRILNGQVVEVEFALNPPQQVIGGLVQSEPDDMSGLLCPSARLRNGDVSNPLARLVDAGSHHAGFMVKFRACFNQYPLNACWRFLPHGLALSRAAWERVRRLCPARNELCLIFDDIGISDPLMPAAMLLEADRRDSACLVEGHTTLCLRLTPD
jgi:hypothetical protein